MIRSIPVRTTPSSLKARNDAAVGASSLFKVGESWRAGIPARSALSIVSADWASAFVPGWRSTKSPRELTRNGRIVGSVSDVVCSVSGVLEIVSCR